MVFGSNLCHQIVGNVVLVKSKWYPQKVAIMIDSNPWSVKSHDIMTPRRGRFYIAIKWDPPLKNLYCWRSIPWLIYGLSPKNQNIQSLWSRISFIPRDSKHTSPAQQLSCATGDIKGYENRLALDAKSQLGRAKDLAPRRHHEKHPFFFWGKWWSGWWFGTFFNFLHILGIIIPSDSYFSEGFTPSRYNWQIWGNPCKWTGQMLGWQRAWSICDDLIWLHSCIFWDSKHDKLCGPSVFT